MIERKCKRCKKIFKKYRSHIKDGKGIFCSKKCFILFRRNDIKFVECLICKKPVRTFPSWKTKYFRGKLCSVKCQRIYQVGENTPGWKGNNVKYNGIHQWLYRTFGKATKCENLDCRKEKAVRFEWALIRGKAYKRKRENFRQLCIFCHRKYDYKPETAKQHSKFLKTYYKTHFHPMNGKKHSKKTIALLRKIHATSCKCPHHIKSKIVPPQLKLKAPQLRVK